MHKSFNKSLVRILILAIAILPFRMAFSMPVAASGNNSGQHCKDMVTASMHQDSLMQSHGKHLPSTDEQIVEKDDCCSTGSNDCSGCAHITVVHQDILQLSDLPDNDVFYLIPFSLLTRIISPPSRPPLVTHV